jgi:transcriptional regulator with XRE-family HTH domain
MSKTSRKTQQAQSGALRGLIALRETLAQDNPPFRLALATEADAEEFCANVRKELRYKRKSLKIDQKEMGRRLNLNQSAISKIESGQGDIGVKTLHRYANALGLRPVLGYVPTVQAMEEHTKAAMPSGVGALLTPVELGSAVAAAMFTAAFDIQLDAQNTFIQHVSNTIAKLTEEKDTMAKLTEEKEREDALNAVV